MRSGARPASRSTCLAGLLVLCLLPASPLRAHPAIEEQIGDLEARIARVPRDATLYLRRGELLRIEGDARGARADYRRARRLAPGLAVVDLCLGILYLEQEKPRRALSSLDRFLAARPDDSEGLATRARALERLGKHLRAAEDFGRALARPHGARLPEPDLYLERARALLAAGPGRLEEALRALDEGIERLGPIVSLEIYAMELETRAGRFEAALQRLDLVAAQASRRDPWEARRREILEAAARAGHGTAPAGGETDGAAPGGGR